MAPEGRRSGSAPSGAPNMTGFDIPYRADGERMIGRLVTPDGGGGGPAVLLAHEAPGLTEHTKERAERLAALGYVAFAADYHGGGARIPEADARARLSGWWAEPTGIRLRMAAALEVLRAQDGVDTARIAAIGFCYGGAAALELARTGADLKAVVGFHPGLITARAAESRNIRAKVLVCVGSDDPYVTPEHRAAFDKDMTEAKVDWTMTVYGGVQHSFTNPQADNAGVPGLAYHALADRRSWRAMLDLLAETIGTP